jgi:preprotein translocase subunit SecY
LADERCVIPERKQARLRVWSEILTTADLSAPRPDPRIRVLITIGALVVLFLGTHIPFPGLSPDFLDKIRSGPTLGRISIFALGVTPIVLAVSMVEIFRLIVPPLARWASRAENAVKVDRTARVLALVVAGFQAFGIALAVEKMKGFVDDPGLFFRFGLIITAIGATAVLIWLANTVTRYGYGDGLLILLAAPLVGQTGHTVSLWTELSRTGAIPLSPVIGAAILTIAAIGALVLVSIPRDSGPRPSAAAPLSRASLDVWPPLLAATAYGLVVILVSYAMFFMGMRVWRASETFHALALAALIAGFAALRIRAARGDGRTPNFWPMTFLQIAICSGAIVFSYVYQISTENSGFSIVFIVAAALSLFSRSVRL